MKKLAIYLDGTFNTLNNNTNVWRLRSLTSETLDQRVYYSQGVGTKRGEVARGGVAGYGVDDEIIDAYTWLIENFDDGDEIFIFGFSRGAYTARSLSGLISKCGILKLGAPLSIEQLYTRYRLYVAPTIRSLLGKPLPQDASLEERWLTKYSRPTQIRFIGVWDTVGSMGIPRTSAEAKVHQYRFLDTHLRLDNEYAFHALALDEHREDFDATFWTRTVKTGEAGAAERPIENVEQRWFIGCHANVGGGYASDPLSQRPLVWLMEKAAARGLVFREPVVIDETQTAPPINDSYREFGGGFYHFFSKPFYRSVGAAPQVGSAATTSRINETIDGSVFDRWRTDASYRPDNLVAWAAAKQVDPAKLTGAVMAAEPKDCRGMTLDILRLDVSKELLRKMAKEERALFLALGHASNQVNALWKLVIILTNGDTDDPVKQRLEGTQTQAFVRLTIGAMWESWRLVEERFLKRLLGREYLPLLDRPAADALERLKKRFGKGSGLSTIRNNYAFHHPGIDDIDAAFENAAAEVGSEEADWAVYFNKALLNTSFFVSDYVFVHGMAGALSEPDVNEAHQKLMGEMAPVANDLSEFAFGFAAAIFKRYVGPELVMTIVAKVEDAPDIDDIRFPFFVETPGLRNS